MAGKSLISMDVEASGPVPGLFDMISVGLVVIEPSLDRRFYCEFAPLHDAFVPEAYASIGVTREQHLAMPDAEEGAHAMCDWLEGIQAKRLMGVSDNPGFDFPFLSWYLWKFAGRNPLGHSARRIGDYYAGLKNNFFESQGWKKLRKTVHSHNALDDAVGNAEAFLQICPLRQRS